MADGRGRGGKWRWGWELGLLLVALLGVYAFTQWRGAASAAAPRTLPVLALETPAGAALRYASPPGQVQLINFWSPDCPPCIAEIPVLNLLQKALGGRHFTVIGLAVAGTTPLALRQAELRYGIHYPLLLDRTGRAAQTLGGVLLTPTSILVNGQGQVVGRYVGAISLPVVLWHLLLLRL
ncbi:TlpA family protein disulfide reductase [Acidithiobacillus sp.]